MKTLADIILLLLEARGKTLNRCSGFLLLRFAILDKRYSLSVNGNNIFCKKWKY